jgi:hypothetical protein
MQHPRDPFSSDDAPDDDAAPGGPLPAPAAPPAPPETHHAEAGPEPVAEPVAEPGWPPFGSEVLFESWEPPTDPADPMWDVPFRSSAPYAELTREPEFAGRPWAAEFAEPDGPGRADGAGGEPPALRRPMSPPPQGPWSGPRHARHRNRGPRWGGALLALTGAVALAGAVPLGILGVRTLAQQPVPTVTTAPVANGSPISAPASVAAAAPSSLGQGQTATGPGASGSSSASAAASGSASHSAAGATAAKAATFAFTAGPGCSSLNGVITWPFRAPSGDGWHPATAARSGPCGASFSYSMLANVRDDSGNWHDHYAWIFHTGKTVASCTLSFYIPPSAHATSKAFYWLSTGSDDPENRMADFTVDQKADQGQWVTKGPFTFGGGTVLAEVTDRGVGPVSDSVEAGVLKLRCV